MLLRRSDPRLGASIGLITSSGLDSHQCFASTANSFGSLAPPKKVPVALMTMIFLQDFKTEKELAPQFGLDTLRTPNRTSPA
jgi:hypothetical protein